MTTRSEDNVGEDNVGARFENYLDYSVSNANAVGKSRVVDLDVDIGADAVDYNANVNKESLSVLQTEMRKVEDIVEEIVDKMECLKRRKLWFHSTNESTNARVQNFALFTLFAMLCLGAREIMHLRAFFKQKYLID